MPFSPQLERLTLDEDGVIHDVVVLAEHTTEAGVPLVLVVPEDAADAEGDDMDAWIRRRVEVDGQVRLVDLEDEDDADAAWDAFEEVLALTFSGEGS